MMNFVKTNREAFSIDSSTLNGNLKGTGYSMYNLDSDFRLKEVEKVNYYDNYDYLAAGIMNNTVLQSKVENNTSGSVIGMPTGTMVRTSNGELLNSVMCYDEKGRVTEGYTTQLGGGLQQTTTSYTFTNNPDTVCVVEYNADGAVTMAARYTYAYNKYNDKLQSVNLKLASEDSVRCIVSNEYDDLGRLLKVKHSGNAGEVSYAYNIRNWVTGIKSGSFVENLCYTDSINGNTPCYNGNISMQQWQNNGGTTMGYKFTYDGLNRLTNAEYAEGVNMDSNLNRFDEKVLQYTANGAIKRFSRNGQMASGEYGKIDELRISLNGNQLYNVTDAADDIDYAGSFDFADSIASGKEYWFNGNGALVADANRKIARIDYDNMNNPRRIVFTNGNTTEYVYSYAGEKLRTIHKTTDLEKEIIALNSTEVVNDSLITEIDSTDYHGSFVYDNGKLSKMLYQGGYASFAYKSSSAAKAKLAISFSDDASTVTTSSLLIKTKPINPEDTIPQAINFPDDTAILIDSASIVFPSNTSKYAFDNITIANAPTSEFHYYIQDHLGNNRVVMNESGAVEQITNYYPFGGVFSTMQSSYNTNSDHQPYKYNGKELDRRHGLDWYDYGARNYDAIVPMFTSMDPCCEKFYNVSTYAYCHDNPVMLVDPNGMFDSYFDAKTYADAHHASFENIHYAYDKGEYYVAFGENGQGYVSGGTLERRFEEKLTETDAWNTEGWHNTLLGFSMGGVEYKLGKELDRSLSYVIYDTKERCLNSVKPTVKFKYISHEFNVKTILKTAKAAKLLGRVSGIASFGMATFEIIQGKKNIVGEGGLDIIMTGVGFAPGYGWLISGAYFVGKYILEENNLDIWNK